MILAAGCDNAQTASSSPSTPAPASGIAMKAATAAAAQAASTPSAQSAQPVLASSELVVGQERFVFGLINQQTGLPIKDVPVVGLQFFKVNEDWTATKVSDGQAVYHSENLPAGVFVVRTNFKDAGRWGALVTIRRPGAEPYTVKVDFEVLKRGAVPVIGDAAIPSRNLTKSDVKSLGEICSAAPYDDMHDLTIADAIKSGKPTVLLFGTPGFCESLTCGPTLEVTQGLEAKYRDKANFIHIETPAEDPRSPKAQAPTVAEWGLKTEPWLFLIDKNGKIFERFEGGLTMEEVEPEFLKLIQ